MNITSFEIVTPLLGGLMIGTSAVILLWLPGRIAGVCGIAYGAMSRISGGNFDKEELSWRLTFLLGLILGAAIFHLVSGAEIPIRDINLIALATGGLLVGLGTKLGSGCTSGHGVVGIGRLSVRSIVATMTFMIAGITSMFVFRHVLGLI